MPTHRQPEPGWRNRGRWRQILREDRGAAAIAETVVVFPLLMTVILLIAHVAVWAQAVHTAQAAASQGLSAARAQDATATDGRTHARTVLGQLGGPLRNVTITADRDGERTEVRVDGSALPVLPWLHLPVHAQAAGPTEEFQPPTETGAAP
ncbi:pilus assembly protein [Streptomyces sp. DSM 44917]|uniref:Pilus assembly protein n=1 Tax=Streptomyces boetiae TaxID=3075541 RepID=A0ABU2L7G0_9ACTN|nr:pilus assembly protein [Streptomyces sp. DSM 44917]MDT0307267.1 pilus assembly protein [Streptomyces sp. DSM 44917]